MTGEPRTDLPIGWRLANLRGIAEVNPRLDKSAPADNPTVSFVPMPAVEVSTGVIDVSQTRRLEEVKKGYTPFREGDVLFAKITPCMENGKMAIVPPLKNGLGFGSTEFHVLRPYREISASYIYYLVSSEQFRRDAQHNMTGAVGQRRVPTSYLADQSIPVPPAREQRRIVAKIEELFSELDKGVESLKTAREQLKVYRQAVLKHAFEGKLTAQWREENKDKLEKPEQLLARIKQERETRYERKLKEWKAAVKKWEGVGKLGKKPPKPREPKRPDSCVASPVHNPFWTQLLLDGLAAESVLGKMLDKGKNTGTARHYLGNLNLRWGKFDLKNLKTMKLEDSEIQRYSLTRGDLVICEGGEPGRCAVWKGTDHTMLIQKALHRVRFTESYSPYFAYYSMTYAARSGLLSPNFTGSTIKHLTGAGLGNVLFPLCTLAEQNQIVRLLDRTFNLCDELDCQLEREIRRAGLFRQSVLSRAFAGQLVAQDPSDEPASVLLDRIKANKEQISKKAAATKKTRGKRTSA